MTTTLARLRGVRVQAVVDIGDASQCPQAESCESCGSEDDLTWASLDTAVGTLCATLCSPCIDDGRYPKLSWVQAAERSFQHASHLGIDVDQAAELRQSSFGDGGMDL